MQFMKHGSLRDIQMDDVADFKLTDDAMTHMGLSDADKLAIYTVIAGVLHLGNISFEESHDDSTGLCELVGSCWLSFVVNTRAVLKVTSCSLQCQIM